MGVGFATVMVTTSQQTVRAKTPLEVRVDSAREIRQILARPIPGPEPLPAISTKVSGPIPKSRKPRSSPPSQVIRKSGGKHVRLSPVWISDRVRSSDLWRLVAKCPPRRSRLPTGSILGPDQAHRFGSKKKPARSRGGPRLRGGQIMATIRERQ
jgi:hypothetical protein